MKKIHLCVKEQPVYQKRHRHFNNRVYDPSSKDKLRVKALLFKHVKKFFTDKPAAVIINFKIQRPKSHYRTGKNSHLLKKNAPVFHTKKPDIDNFVKFYLDVLTALKVWNDDSQVINLSASKQYTEKDPRTEITIYKI